MESETPNTVTQQVSALQGVPSARFATLLAFHAALPFLCGAAELVGADIYVALAITAMQLFLLAMWVGLGPWSTGARILTFGLGNCYVVVSTLGGAWSIQSREFQDPDFNLSSIVTVLTMLAFGTSGLLSAAFVCTRYWFKLRRVTAPVPDERIQVTQFGVRHLLGVTFLCGGVIAALGLFKQGIRPPFLLSLAILLAPLFLSVFVWVWTVMPPRFQGIRLAIALVVNLSVVTLMNIQLEYDPLAMWRWLPGLALVVLTLFALRSEGFRLVRRQKIAATESAGHQSEGHTPPAMPPG